MLPRKSGHDPFGIRRSRIARDPSKAGYVGRVVSNDATHREAHRASPLSRREPRGSTHPPIPRATCTCHRRIASWLLAMTVGGAGGTSEGARSVFRKSMRALPIVGREPQVRGRHGSPHRHDGAGWPTPGSGSRRRGNTGRNPPRPRAGASSTPRAAGTPPAAAPAASRASRRRLPSVGRRAGGAGSRCRRPRRRPCPACGRPHSRSRGTGPCPRSDRRCRSWSSGAASTGRGSVSTNATSERNWASVRSRSTCG